jgi:hypothetical protein
MNSVQVGQLRDVLSELKDHNDQIKILNEKKRNLELSIMDDLDESGLTLARTEFGTVSLTTEQVASVEDWNAFEEYIYDHRALYLLQRRASNPAYREEINQRGPVPGVSAFTKRKLSLRNVAV